jgi:hypothetical protein
LRSLDPILEQQPSLAGEQDEIAGPVQPLADPLMVIHQHEIEIAAEQLEAGLAALAGRAVFSRDILAFERDMGLVAVVDAQLTNRF